MSTLEDVLVPVYFYHRFQISATASVIGGVYYNHALRGGPQYIQKPIPAKEQKLALAELLKTIHPENLVISQRILKLIPPRALAPVTIKQLTFLQVIQVEHLIPSQQLKILPTIHLEQFLHQQEQQELF